MDKSVNDINNTPFVLDETNDFTVVYKPPRMHSAPLQHSVQLQNSGGDTLADWYAAQFPQVGDLSGRRGGESLPVAGRGLLHRLDFETHGLVLFAKTQQSFDFLLTQQEQGNFTKEYSAICQKSDAAPPSFPPPPFTVSPELAGSAIESFFRPFGPGRKQVRPVTDDNGKACKAAHKEIAKDNGNYYRTEIVNVINNIADNGRYAFTVRLKRGFRHQIRCHLAWIGCPVADDPIYGAQPVIGDFLALRSHALFFPDPASGKQREYRIEPLFKRSDYGE
jgi:23S rRNA pseudouridine1911/1915/1917 synthase